MEKYKELIALAIICITLGLITNDILRKDIEEVHVKYNIVEGFDISGSFYNK